MKKGRQGKDYLLKKSDGTEISLRGNPSGRSNFSFGMGKQGSPEGYHHAGRIRFPVQGQAYREPFFAWIGNSNLSSR